MSVKNFRELGRKIVCVGRNYREHALELKNPIPSKPLLFVKTTNSYVSEGSPIEIPEGCTNLHHEGRLNIGPVTFSYLSVELAVIIGKLAKKISKQDAMNYVAGYAVALDLTARDWQVSFTTLMHNRLHELSVATLLLSGRIQICGTAVVPGQILRRLVPHYRFYRQVHSFRSAQR